MKFENKNNGFTLVELLVVISIIAVLLSIMMPALGKAQALARRVKCASNLRQINLAINLYTNDNNNYYPSAQDPLPSGNWLWMGRGFRPIVEPYIGKQVGRHISVLICPEDNVAENLYESTSYAYSMAFYHSPATINSLSSPADTYGATAPKAVNQSTADVRHTSGKILLGEWLSNHEKLDDDKGWWAWQGTRNFSFADGSNEFIAAEDIIPANDQNPNPNLTVNGIAGRDVQR